MSDVRDAEIISDDEIINNNEQRRVTKRDLVERGIEPLGTPSPGVTVQHHPSGGVSQVNLPQVVEVAKFMAGAQEGVPQHCRGNVGICLRVTFQAVEWRMSPFSVADMSFIVNGRLAYMSQLLHAVVEGRAPLQHRLDCTYAGEGQDRTCTVTGYFVSGDVREYTTPKVKDIRVKNSPLWKDDPDQQLFYYASRSWARKWCPDVLLGCYTREELRENPTMGGNYEVEAPGLHKRLSGAPRSEEGHRVGHVDSELEQVVAEAGRVPAKAKEPAATPTPPKGKKPASEAPKGKAKGRAKTSPPRTRTLVNPASLPSKAEIKRVADRAEKKKPEPKEKKQLRTVEDYIDYARGWITMCTDADALFAQWRSEMKLRNDLGVTSDDRVPLDELLIARREELSGE